MMDPRWQSTTHVQTPPAECACNQCDGLCLPECPCCDRAPSSSPLTPDPAVLPAASMHGVSDRGSATPGAATCPTAPGVAVPLSDVPEHLRVRLVELVLDEVSAGHWSPLRAAEELAAFGFAASAEKVKAAMRAGDNLFDYPDEKARDVHDFLIARLARPVGGLTKGRAA